MQILDINIRDIQAFEQVYCLRSMSKTAQQLFTTRQSIARSVSTLEQLTGQELFQRNYSGMEPSDFCEKFYPYVVELLSSAQRLADFSKQYDSAKGTITVGLLGLYQMSYTIKKLLNEYSTICPNLNVIVKYRDWPDIYNAIIDGEIDFAYSAILPGYMPEEVKFYPVIKKGFVAIIDEQSQLARQDVLDAEQLQGGDIVLLSRFGIHSTIFESYQQENGVQFANCISTADADILADTIKSGGAIGLVDEDAVISIMRTSRGLCCRKLMPEPHRSSGFLYRRSFSMLSSHKALLTFLKNGILQRGEENNR